MRWLFVLMVGLLVVPALAQSDQPGITPISYNSTVEDTITDEATFDWWQVVASAGDEMRVQMLASDGLAPLVAILSPGGTRLATSEEGTVDGRVSLDYTVSDAGLYTILATRAGETTGSYTLTLQRLNTEPPVSETGEVTFLCDGVEMVVLASVQFAPDETDGGSYPLYIYGFDGLLPAIRFLSSEQDIDVCHRDAQDQAGDVITIPGAEPVTLEADQLDTASQLLVNAGGANLGAITITFGAEANVPGRYLAIVGGFNITPTSQIDSVRVHPGALASRETAMQVYMIGVGANNRLDPFMRFADNEISCDDAGRRACANVPSINGAGVVFSLGGQIVGDRFDGGLNFEAGSLGWQEIELGSFSGDTGGEYALVFVGELPLRTLDEGE